MEVGDVVVVLFGKTEWVVEVAEAPAPRRGYRGSPDEQMVFIAKLDRAQFGKYPTREGDRAWFAIEDVIA